MILIGYGLIHSVKLQPVLRIVGGWQPLIKRDDREARVENRGSMAKGMETWEEIELNQQSEA